MILPTESKEIDIEAGSLPEPTSQPSTMEKLNYLIIVARTGITSYESVGEYTKDKINLIETFSKETSFMKIMTTLMIWIAVVLLFICLPMMVPLNPVSEGFDYNLGFYLLSSMLIPNTSVVCFLLHYFPIETPGDSHGLTKIAIKLSLFLTMFWLTSIYLLSVIIFPFPFCAFVAFLLATNAMVVYFISWHLIPQIKRDSANGKRGHIKKSILGYTCVIACLTINTVMYPMSLYFVSKLKSEPLFAALFTAAIFPMLKKLNKGLMALSFRISGRLVIWLSVSISDGYYLFFLGLVLQQAEGYSTIIVIMIMNAVNFYLEYQEGMDVLALNKKSPDTVKRSVMYIMFEDTALLSFYKCIVPLIYSIFIPFVVFLSPNRNYIGLFNETFYTLDQLKQTVIQLLIFSSIEFLFFAVKIHLTKKHFDIDLLALLTVQLNQYRCELALAILISIIGGVNASLNHVGNG